MDLLDLFGRGYVIEHCISHLKQISKDEAYRIYITDALKAIADNTGKLVKDGVGMRKRFSDFISESADESDKDAEKEAQKIKDHMKNVLAKLGKEDG